MTGTQGNLDSTPVERIVVGLGNPGAEYTGTRHNLGFKALDAFLKARGIPKHFEPIRKARAQTVLVDDINVLLVRPGTFMNLSGLAVVPLIEKTGIDISGLLVVHDEMDLPVGRAKMRIGGGSAGHGGVQDIIDRCGESFARLRIGIGSQPEPGPDAGADWVLSKIDPTEEVAFEKVLTAVAEGIRLWIIDGPDRAMTQFNTATSGMAQGDRTDPEEDDKKADD